MWGQGEGASGNQMDCRGEAEDLVGDTGRRKQWRKGQESVLHLKETGANVGTYGRVFGNSHN